MLGFVAALVHAFNHSIMKVLMFMCAGSIMHGTGSKNLELFGGSHAKCRIPLFLLSSLAGTRRYSADERLYR